MKNKKDKEKRGGGRTWKRNHTHPHKGGGDRHTHYIKYEVV